MAKFQKDFEPIKPGFFIEVFQNPFRPDIFFIKKKFRNLYNYYELDDLKIFFQCNNKNSDGKVDNLDAFIDEAADYIHSEFGAQLHPDLDDFYDYHYRTIDIIFDLCYFHIDKFLDKYYKQIQAIKDNEKNSTDKLDSSFQFDFSNCS